MTASPSWARPQRPPDAQSRPRRDPPPPSPLRGGRRPGNAHQFLPVTPWRVALHLHHIHHRSECARRHSPSGFRPCRTGLLRPLHPCGRPHGPALRRYWFRSHQPHRTVALGRNLPLPACPGTTCDGRRCRYNAPRRRLPPQAPPFFIGLPPDDPPPFPPLVPLADEVPPPGTRVTVGTSKGWRARQHSKSAAITNHQYTTQYIIPEAVALSEILSKAGRFRMGSAWISKLSTEDKRYNIGISPTF